ncbi:hypothetical protein B296_00044217 [Ensete ventricosum]|uniref:Uncharacterized protein n=1 Tax=Ensete ventricosum TaxID=4639 RepID=A0A426Z767_ENSVE|nr:hypothetical protein B296_00044217 [Ensete ventricosum]
MGSCDSGSIAPRAKSTQSSLCLPIEGILSSLYRGGNSLRLERWLRVAIDESNEFGGFDGSGLRLGRWCRGAIDDNNGVSKDRVGVQQELAARSAIVGTAMDDGEAAEGGDKSGRAARRQEWITTVEAMVVKEKGVALVQPTKEEDDRG